MAVCTVPQEAGLVERITDAVDCNIALLVHDSYRALVGPGTWFATAFTGLLTIYIALIGYQLLLGRGGLRVTELPVSALKVGLVLAFLTSWAAYQTVVFDLLFEGPRQIVAALLAPLAASGGGFDGDVERGVERAFAVLSEAASVHGGQASPSANILQGGPMLGSGLLWLFSILLLLFTVGLMVAVKIVLAFLLAVGPIFIGLMLFDATRGLFDGWMRTTLAFALAPAGVSVFTAVFLMIAEPFLALIEANAAKRAFDMGAVITLGLVLAVFIMVTLFGLGAIAGVARGWSRGPAGGRGPALLRLADPAFHTSQGQNARAERLAAEAAVVAQPDARAASDRTLVRERAAEISSAFLEPPPVVGDRLGQAYSRSARPVLRRGDAAEG